MKWQTNLRALRENTPQHLAPCHVTPVKAKICFLCQIAAKWRAAVSVLVLASLVLAVSGSVPVLQWLRPPRGFLAANSGTSGDLLEWEENDVPHKFILDLRRVDVTVGRNEPAKLRSCPPIALMRPLHFWTALVARKLL